MLSEQFGSFRERKGSGIFSEQSRDYLHFMEFLSLEPGLA